MNNGDSWREARGGLAQFRSRTLMVDPADSNRVYSGSINRFNSNDGSLARSADGGATWTNFPLQAPVLSLALHPTDGQTVWFSTTTGQYGTFASLYRSRDQGANFQEILGTYNIPGVALDPANPRNVYAIAEYGGVYQLARSTDEGANFSQGQQTTIQMVTVVVDPVTPANIYLGTNGGVYRSTDSGANHRLKRRFARQRGRAGRLDCDRQARRMLYAATSSGVYKRAGGESSWTAANGGLENLTVRQLVIDPHTPNALYAATLNGGVWRTTDGGATWNPTGTNAAIISRESVVGAFDFVGGGVAPGELVSIFGPASGRARAHRQPRLTHRRASCPPELAGVQVFVNDVASRCST
ncbi:MAG: hypothetical protein R2724_23580 [Bryobacterales bacterium]